MPSKIGIDIISGEKSPQELFLALKAYSLENPEDSFIVFIDRETLSQGEGVYSSTNNIQIIEVEDKISMEDSPIKGVRKKKNSSIVKGLEFLKEKKIDFFFSPGNTGAIVYGAVETIGLLKNVDFPAIGVIIPNINGPVLLLDAGSSALIDEDRGLILALMGKIFYENYFQVANPAIGILNIGKEWYKGPKWVRKLDYRLKKENNMNYYGFVEGFDLVTSPCHIYVTGGYTGNILLKGLEGIYYFLKSYFKKSGQPGLTDVLKSNIHYSNTGTGIVLGLKENIFIGHGITGGEALQNLLPFAKKVSRLNLPVKIESEIRNRRFFSKFLSKRREK
ncbi:MAG TPA: hypothetical protein DHW82_12580 [Spirochaetia bacterium]|nr:MAG: hypothetical protein A2Y41_07425 [Spirochaetes bacterium GWB1_36_13]HCL57825.1 hypothetical protein [Spirochaetia bacterium]